MIAKASLFFVALLIAQSVRAGEVRDFEDDTGAQVHVSEHPRRIVTLAPSVGELAAEVLAGDLDRIVGVSESTDFPPGLKNIESVGPYQRFNLEKVAALKPDLILATLQGNSKDQVQHLRELGLPVFVLATGNFLEIELAMKKTAALLGDREKGLVLADRFGKSLLKIKARGREHAKKPTRVLIQLDEQPVVVAGGASFLSEALNTIGAENVYGDSKVAYPRPSVEDVLRRNPDFIMVMAFGPELKRFQRMAARWNQYPNLAAARSKRIRVVYADALLRPSMRLLEGLAVLERTVYGQN